MAYDVEFTISIKAGDLGTVTSKFKAAGITDINSKKVTFSPNDTPTTFLFKSEPAGEPAKPRALICKKIRLVSPEEKLAYLHLKSTSTYVFKQCPTGDISGIAFRLSKDEFCGLEPQKDPSGAEIFDAENKQIMIEKKEGPQNSAEADGCDDLSSIIWLRSDYAVVDFCDQPKESRWLAIFVDPALFNCSKSEDITITLSYGIRGKAQASFAPCCGQAAPSAGISQQMGRMARTA